MSAQGQAGNQSGVLGLTRRVADRQGRDGWCLKAFGLAGPGAVAPISRKPSPTIGVDRGGLSHALGIHQAQGVPGRVHPSRATSND